MGAEKGGRSMWVPVARVAPIIQTSGGTCTANHLPAFTWPMEQANDRIHASFFLLCVFVSLFSLFYLLSPPPSPFLLLPRATRQERRGQGDIAATRALLSQQSNIVPVSFYYIVACQGTSKDSPPPHSF
jgi:hypothetical protein